MSKLGDERIQIIKERITRALNPTHLEVYDESDKHIGHAGHQGGGRHFSVVIKAESLSALTRVHAHQKIYALFTDLMPDAIHALKIKIIK